MTEELTRKRTNSIQHQHKGRADYNTIPINELINKIKVPGSKGFKILKELNDQQLKIMGTQYGQEQHCPNPTSSLHNSISKHLQEESKSPVGATNSINNQLSNQETLETLKAVKKSDAEGLQFKNINKNLLAKKNHYLLSILNASTKECSLCRTSLLQSVVQKNLNTKYLMTKESYNVKIINDIVYNESVHIVCIFKEYLIYDDISEFLRRFYKSSESVHRLPKIFDFYDKYSKVFPNYVNLKESKYMFKNIERKQKLIDEAQKQGERNKNNISSEEENEIFTESFLEKLNKQGSTYDKSMSQTILQSYMKSSKGVKLKRNDYQILMEDYLLKDSLSLNESSTGIPQTIINNLEKQINQLKIKQESHKQPAYHKHSSSDAKKGSSNTQRNSQEMTKKISTKIITITQRNSQIHRSSCLNNDIGDYPPLVKSVLSDSKPKQGIKKITLCTSHKGCSNYVRPQSTRTSRVNSDGLHLNKDSIPLGSAKNIDMAKVPLINLDSIKSKAIHLPHQANCNFFAKAKNSEPLVIDGKITNAQQPPKVFAKNINALEKLQEEKFYKLIGSARQSNDKLLASHTVTSPAKPTPSIITKCIKGKLSRNNSSTPVLSTSHKTPHQTNFIAANIIQAKSINARNIRLPESSKNGNKISAQVNNIIRSAKHSPQQTFSGKKNSQYKFNIEDISKYKMCTIKDKDSWGLTYSKSIGEFKKHHGRYDSVGTIAADPIIDILLHRRSGSKEPECTNLSKNK